MERASQVVAGGGVIAFRTDTFYGLGADPLNPRAVQKIRELKGREDTKPILLLISDQEVVDRLISNRSELFDSIATRFWPGPLTIVGAARDEIPEELTSGSKTIGVRLPDDESVRELVRSCGGALTATSANPSGGLPARSAEEVKVYFPTGIDLIIDDGEVLADKPSTVIRIVTSELEVIRVGAISEEQLRSAS
jgi:L-threonylcarbamoyladenylate synthase